MVTREATISVNNDHVELNPQKKLVTNCRGVCHIIMAWAGAGVGWGRTRTFTSEQTLVRDRALERYQPQFDGLRALAVLTVMVDHFSADVPNFPLPDWIRLGATGVRLFLVLSGYFITASLRRARDRMDGGGYRPVRRSLHFTGGACFALARPILCSRRLRYCSISAQSVTIGRGFSPARWIG
jgi:Predicted acyltransferases